MVSDAREKSRSTVEIYGEKYTIVGYENEEHIYKVASLVDKKMREIKMKNHNLDTRKLAVLTAVNSINELLKCQEELSRLKNEIKVGE